MLAVRPLPRFTNISFSFSLFSSRYFDVHGCLLWMTYWSVPSRWQTPLLTPFARRLPILFIPIIDLRFSCLTKNLAPLSQPLGGSPSHSSSSSVSSGGLYFAVGAGSTCGSEALNQSISSHKSSHGVVPSCDLNVSRMNPADQLAALSIENAEPSPAGDAASDGKVLNEEPSVRYSLSSHASNLDTLTQQPHTFIPQQQYPGSAESGSVFCFQVIRRGSTGHQQLIIPLVS